MKIIASVILNLILFSFILINSASSQEPDKPVISVQKENERVFILSVGEENSILFSADDGNILLISGHTLFSDDLVTTIKKISNKPLKFIIYSHIHNKEFIDIKLFEELNTTVIVQENSLNRLPKIDENAFLLITFGNSFSIFTDNEEIYLQHYPSAHTDGDIVVYFKNSNLLYTGNIFYPKSFPFIDIGSGGTVKGYLDALNEITKITDKKTVILPGSGAVSNQKTLEEFQKMFKNSKNRIELLISANKPLREILNEKPLDDFNKKWENGAIRSQDFIINLYEGLSNQKIN
ncbi:MAG: hypothetical protein ACRENO_01250 [Thermodesulfobacteriota bacterium]